MRLLCWTVCANLSLAFLASAGPLAPALQSQAGPSNATVVLAGARSVAVVGKTGKEMMSRGWASPNGERAKEKVENVLREAGYSLVDDPATADLVAVVLEYQKNLNLLKRAQLVAELKVYRGGADITEETPPLWSGQANEGWKKLPATKVAEEFRDHATKLRAAAQPPGGVQP